MARDMSNALRLTLLGIAASATLTPGLAQAQRAVDLQLGRWAVPGPDPTVYAAALWGRLWGPLGYDLRGIAVVDRDSAGRSLYGIGPDLTLLRGSRDRGGLSFYGVGGAALAVSSGASKALVAVWSAGVGMELSARSLVSVTVEARRFAEDRDFRGFWDLQEGDRQGWLLSAGFSIRWGGGGSSPPGRLDPYGQPGGSDAERPLPTRPVGPTGDARVDLANRIVDTALGAMGEPYRWGGTSTEEGFDCSGLVWYAYAAHGIELPRVSRDQARSGRAIPADIADLESGDILLFSNRPGAITHVGLYIGDARFIHATTSGGVRVGALDVPADENDRWWRSRWVGARRVLD